MRGREEIVEGVGAHMVSMVQVNGYSLASSHTDTDTGTDTDTDTDTHRHRHRHTDTHRQTQAHRHTQTHADTHTHPGSSMVMCLYGVAASMTARTAAMPSTRSRAWRSRWNSRCICKREREKERERGEGERERGSVCVCVCVCVRSSVCGFVALHGRHGHTHADTQIQTQYVIHAPSPRRPAGIAAASHPL